MSSIVISGDTSGAITLSAPTVAGTNTATLPAATGTVMVSGNMPAFSVYTNTSTTLSSGTWTKINCEVKQFDTNTNYSTSTYKFTPTVAGYYQVNAGFYCSSTSGNMTSYACSIYKNGSFEKRGNALFNISATEGITIVSVLVYMNGTTDYLEPYVRIVGTGTLTVYSDSTNGINLNYFQASMVRAA